MTDDKLEELFGAIATTQEYFQRRFEIQELNNNNYFYAILSLYAIQLLVFIEIFFVVKVK